MVRMPLLNAVVMHTMIQDEISLHELRLVYTMQQSLPSCTRLWVEGIESLADYELAYGFNFYDIWVFRTCHSTFFKKIRRNQNILSYSVIEIPHLSKAIFRIEHD